MKPTKWILAMAFLIAPALASAQVSVGENTKLSAGGLFTFGYAGDYGDQIPSSHGLTFGVDGTLSGYYYNPNFINFSATPYYNQSRNNSSYRSLTGASGITTTTNFFTGSNFPGTVAYHYDANSTGTFGLGGQPDFTTYGRGQGFSIGWSALVPDLPTLSVSYSQGSGSGTIYGTDEETHAHNKLFNIRSNYSVAGFRLNGFYDHTNWDSQFPVFLSGQQESESKTSGSDWGFGANHNLPFNGSFYANFDHSKSDSDYFMDRQTVNTSSYTNNNENAGVSFHPTNKLTLFGNQNYTSNLSGYLNQQIANGGPPIVNLGSGAHSYTIGGGATYQVTNFLSTQAQATWYDQEYFGHNYSGTFVSATVNYAHRLLDIFAFSASLIESSNGQGTNALGFIGNVNAAHRFGQWQVSGNFSYAQNVQTLLVTYTTSYYNYSANLHRRFPHRTQWTAAFNGNHSGLTQDPGTSNHSESFSTSFGSRIATVTGNYSVAHGVSFLGAGLIPAPPTPGLVNFTTFDGRSYGGGISSTPLHRLTLSGSYTRAFSDTVGNNIPSHNDSQIFNAQLQYHLRRIGLQAGVTRFRQSISAAGAPPANTTTYFFGISRWFDFF